MAHCHNILLLLHLMNPFREVQTCPKTVPRDKRTIKHKIKFVSQTTNLLFTPKLESHWGSNMVLRHWLTCHTDSRVLLLTFYRVYRKNCMKQEKCNHRCYLNISVGSYLHQLYIIIQELITGSHKRLPHRKAAGVLRKTRRGRGEKRSF